jgi:hypothetical protein
MPPMLYAVGVLDVEVDKQGQVTRTYWVRAPGHAPEVMREIEKTVRLAAPYPVLPTWARWCTQTFGFGTRAVIFSSTPSLKGQD